VGHALLRPHLHVGADVRCFLCGCARPLRPVWEMAEGAACGVGSSAVGIGRGTLRPYGDVRQHHSTHLSTARVSGNPNRHVRTGGSRRPAAIEKHSDGGDLSCCSDDRSVSREYIRGEPDGRGLTHAKRAGSNDAAGALHGAAAGERVGHPARA